MAELKHVEWLAPWGPTDPGLERELHRDIGSSQHPLHGRSAVAVARRSDTDDVLFFLPDGPEPLAVVHLTWAEHPERRPEWPSTDFFASLTDWIERGMKVDARER